MHKRTAEFTGLSFGSVKRILLEKNATDLVLPPKMPTREPLLFLDESEKSLVRRTVHEFFFENRPPTLDAVLARIKDKPEIRNMSRSKLWTLLKDLHFQFVKRSRQSILIDREDIILWRRKYLSAIREFRAEGRPIFYLDETSVNAGHTKSKVWVDTSVRSHRQAFIEGLSTGLKNPSGAGKREIIVHIGSNDGFVTGGDCFILKGLKLPITTMR